MSHNNNLEKKIFQKEILPIVIAIVTTMVVEGNSSVVHF
jgi:hypothetical protein